MCKLFAEIKNFLIYPANEKEISQMEQAVRELLKENTTVYNQQIVQQYACELARAETATDNKTNQEKLAQEKSLWTNIEVVEANQPPPVPPKPKNSQMRRSSTGKATG
jgi:ABC-type transporter MlaC component